MADKIQKLETELSKARVKRDAAQGEASALASRVERLQTLEDSGAEARITSYNVCYTKLLRVRNYLGSLSTIFTEAVRLGLIPGNPCAGVVRPRKAPRIKKDSLRPHELAALFRESALETVWGATEGNHRNNFV